MSTSNATSVGASTDPLPLNCEGYHRLLADVQADETKHPKFHDYRGKLKWAVARAQHYAEKTGLTPEAIMDAWEQQRGYWYMNFYQEANQPEIEGDNVRVFETVADMMESIGHTGFRCPACEGVSNSPYQCTTGIARDGKTCDWKVYGLFGHLGKGVSVFVKEKVAGENIFLPVAWESGATGGEEGA